MKINPTSLVQDVLEQSEIAPRNILMIVFGVLSGLFLGVVALIHNSWKRRNNEKNAIKIHYPESIWVASLCDM